MKRLCLYLSIALLAPCALRAQGRSFEGWQLYQQQMGYALSPDSADAHGGSMCALIRALVPGYTGNASFSQHVRADEFRGKRVRFSIWVRTRDVTKTSDFGVGVYMRVDGDGGSLGFFNTGARPVNGTTDWVKREVVLDVPNGAVGILLGVTLRGAGEFLFDDASLEVVTSKVPVMATTRRAPVASDSAKKAQLANFADAPLALVNAGFEKLR